MSNTFGSMLFDMGQNKRMEHMTDFRTVLGQGFYISTADTFDVGFETMIFYADKNDIMETGCDVTDWHELYAKRYNTRVDAIMGHNKLLKLNQKDFVALLNFEEDEE